MVNNQDLKNCINRGVDFIDKEQLDSGGFLSLSSLDEIDYQDTITYRTIFPAFLILWSLSYLPETLKIKKIKDGAVKFLLSEKSEHWSYNYWVRGSKEFKSLAYPDDLDDTFYALSALLRYDPKIIDGEAMAKIAMLLTALEEKEGGPYKTWLAPADSLEIWKDVDLAVNSNIACFLAMQGIDLPNVISFIESRIDENDITSAYYTTVHPIIYYFSRFYRGDRMEKLMDILLSKKDENGCWDNPLNTALAVCALLNFGYPAEKLEKSIEYLVCEQGSDGSFKPYTFFPDPVIEGKKWYAGAASVTTAICLEAIGKYLKAKAGEEAPAKSRPDKSFFYDCAANILQKTVQKSVQRFSSFDKDTQSRFLMILEETLRGDKDKQIILLPYFFKSALKKDAENISDDVLAQLGLANLYGWIAYTIYDDFLDDEGDPKFLSIANVCSREALTIYHNLFSGDAGFWAFLMQIMDTLESANTWETSHCRLKIRDSKFLIPEILPDYGDYSKLAERSMGHCLGPAAILFSLGYCADSPEVKGLISFFKHYIIARQLNDDAHDWEEDLKKGHINAAVSLLLKKWQKETGRMEADIEKNLLEFQKIFWYEIVIGVCEDIKKHIHSAREVLEKNSAIKGKVFFQKILLPIEASANKAIEEQSETIDFLKTYKT